MANAGENAEFARRALGGEGERRYWDMGRMREASMEHWHPEIVYEEAPDWPGAGTFAGREEILARFEEYSEALGELEAEVERLDELEDGRVFAIIRAFGHTIASVPVERRWGYVFTVRDSKLYHWRAEADPDRTRVELGLAE